MTAAARKTNYQTGLLAEALAALFLRAKGYRILKTRYKTPVGEIDIIARRGRMLAMVEVKARPSVLRGLEAVNATAQQRIARAAQHFIAGHPGYAGYDLRFDVIVYTPPLSITHLDNAWQARS